MMDRSRNVEDVLPLARDARAGEIVELEGNR